MEKNFFIFQKKTDKIATITFTIKLVLLEKTQLGWVFFYKARVFASPEKNRSKKCMNYLFYIFYSN